MLFRAIDHHIPQRTLKRRSRPPWIDNEIMKLSRKKKKLWKRLKTNGSADLFLKFKDLRRKTKKLINSSYQHYLQSLSGKLQENPRHFWAFYSIKSKTKRIPETVIYGDTRSRDLNSKVELFNAFFHSVYSKSTTDVKLLTIDVVNPNLLFEVTTTAPELEGILSKINVNKAPSVGNLLAHKLRTCAKELSIPLAHLFNLSLTTGKMPTLKKLTFMSLEDHWPT